MMNEAEKEALATPEYWNNHYSSSDGTNPSHEWFKSFAALEPFFNKYLFPTHNPASNPRILHLGSGDSTVPYDLARRGYDNQLCVDFSPTVVDLMSSRQEHAQRVKWTQGDVRDMNFVESTTIDVAFDKGTMDAMIHGSPWDPPDIVLENTGAYLREVYRVLKNDGVFLYITFRQPHFIKPILNRENLWLLEMDVLSSEAGSFDYFGFILKKAQR